MPSPFLSVSLTGDKAVLANIKALDKKITTKAITKASREAQKKTAADAKRRVPVKTGKLKDWIKVRAVPKKYLMRKFGLTRIEARAVSAIAVTTGAGKATDYPYSDRPTRNVHTKNIAHVSCSETVKTVQTIASSS